ncbi:MAG TPA: ammonium transporter [Bacillota bacterium]|nr:ammonium transporter [Bacillota bacterium]
MEYSIVNTLWVLVAGFLVFFMNLGFAAVESGFARSKNAVNILSKNFIVFAVSSLGFMLLGWGLMQGGTNPFVGTENLWILGKTAEELNNTPYYLSGNGIPFWANFFWMLVFCGTAATIVSGAVAERIKYISFIVFSFILTLLIYPITGHWIWGGGWLSTLKVPFHDFAGSTAVHSVGGWAALTGAALLGPRIGKYGSDGKPKAIPGHNMSLAVIGLFILWLGWFGFNPGSTMSLDNPADVAHIVLTTNTSAIAAILTSTATSWLFIGKPDLGMTINGCLAGLVAVTAGCAYVTVAGSLIIGAIAGVAVVFAVLFFDKIKIDDPVGATSVHLVCGVLGTLLVGLFAKEGVTSYAQYSGIFYGGGAGLLVSQLIGTVSVAAFVLVTSTLVWIIIDKTLGLRVSPEEEIDGLDIGEHGNHAYPDFVIAPPVTSATAVAAPDEAAGDVPVAAEAPPEPKPSSKPGVKITKVEIICKDSKLEALKNALTEIGITGMTVTHVLGCGLQRGQPEYYRGVPVETNLLPKVQVEVVVSKIPVSKVIETAKKVLYTGHIGDGKIFVYDVENVIKVRTGEEGYDALQDVE